MYESQNIARHTTGRFTTSSTPIMNGAGVEGAATLVTDGWDSGAATLKKGDVFTVADVYAVNPQTRQSTGVLQNFVVTADITATGVDITIAISPSLISTGAYQVIYSLPANSAALTFQGTEETEYPVNLGHCPDAFALAMADLELPDGVDFRATASYKGIKLRIVRAYDINNDNFPCRIDVLYGWKTIRPELATRLWG